MEGWWSEPVADGTLVPGQTRASWLGVRRASKDRRAFGWLGAGWGGGSQTCPRVLIARLEDAARRPVDRIRGWQACPLCAQVDGPGVAYQALSGETLRLGDAALEVEAAGETWVAPNLVLHYVTAHHYLPPQPVLAALRPPDSLVAAAARQPGGWVYEIEGSFGPEDAVPPQAIRRGWQVDAAGRLTGEYWDNPNYRPDGSG